MLFDDHDDNAYVDRNNSMSFIRAHGESNASYGNQIVRCWLCTVQAGLEKKMNFDELIGTIDSEPLMIAELPVSSVDRIIAILAAFEVQYGMNSREFRRRYQQLLAETESASERFDYGEWNMMFTALMEQASQVKRAIPKRKHDLWIDESSERPAKAGLILCRRYKYGKELNSRAKAENFAQSTKLL